jgi:hypothetical protein
MYKKTIMALLVVAILSCAIAPLATASEKHFYNPIAKKYLCFETSGQNTVNIWERTRPQASTAGDVRKGTVNTCTIKYAGQKAVLTAEAYKDCVQSCSYIGLCMDVAFVNIPAGVACAAATGTYCGYKCYGSILKINM